MGARKIISALICLLLTQLFVYPQETVVFGTEKDLIGDSLYFYKLKDPITNQKQTIGHCVVNDLGAFRASLDIHTTTTVYLDLGKERIYFFGEPGKSYHLAIPPFTSKSIEDYLNPYFKPRLIHAGFKNSTPDDLNNHIQAFDQFFDPWFNTYARQVYANKKLDDGAKFNREIDSLFGHIDIPYFSDYIAFRKLLVEYLLFSNASKSTQFSMLPYREGDYDNQAYLDLFKQVFSRSLFHFEMMDACTKIRQMMIREDGYPEIRKCIKQTGVVKNDSQIDMIILKGIFDEQQNNYYPRKDLISLLTFMIPDLPDFESEIARDMLTDFTRLDPGKPAPDFQLTDVEGSVHSISDYQGKYLLLGFVSFQSYSSRMQFPLIQELANSFNEDLNIVTISIEENEEVFKNMLEVSPYSWEFLFCSGSDAVLKEYKIRAYPSFFLIDRDGKILWPFDPGPVMEFNSRFSKLLNEEN